MTGKEGAWAVAKDAVGWYKVCHTAEKSGQKWRSASGEHTHLSRYTKGRMKFPRERTKNKKYRLSGQTPRNTNI